MTEPAKINHLSTKESPIFFVFVLSQRDNNSYYHHKILVTTAEFTGLSSEVYRNEILHSELN